MSPPPGDLPRGGGAGARRFAGWPWLLAGAAISVAWELGPAAISVGAWEIHSAIPGGLLLGAVAFARLVEGRGTKVGMFAAGLALAGLPGLVFRGADFGGRALAASGGLALVAVLAAPLLFTGSRSSAPVRRPLLAALVLGTTAVLAVVAFQVSQAVLLARGVPNEARSLVLAGHEVHHVVWGLLLSAAAVVHGPRLPRSGAALWLVLAVAGSGLGMFFDQWLYASLRDMTDEAYFSTATRLSGVGALVVFPLLWVSFRSRSSHV